MLWPRLLRKGKTFIVKVTGKETGGKAPIRPKELREVGLVYGSAGGKVSAGRVQISLDDGLPVPIKSKLLGSVGDGGMKR